jgi:hypothetical protein
MRRAVQVLLEKLRSSVGWPTTTFLPNYSLFSSNTVILSISDIFDLDLRDRPKIISVETRIHAIVANHHSVLLTVPVFIHLTFYQ